MFLAPTRSTTDPRLPLGRVRHRITAVVAAVLVSSMIGPAGAGPADVELASEPGVAATIEASRTACVSPCTVVFSAEGSRDLADPSPTHAFHELGYHFDFDDPTSGVHATTGLPKNTQIGAPLATHTFRCTNGGSCEFDVGVRVQRADGAHDDAFVRVVVDDPTHRYSPAETICVSTSGSFGGDQPCPAGARQVTGTPPVAEVDGVRVLFRRGETFDALCVGYGASNVLAEAFGDTTAAAPVLLGETGIGVDDTCGDFIPNNADVGAADGSSGYPARWAEQITLHDLRPQWVALGMSYTHVELNGLHMDFEHDAEGGAVSLAQNASSCRNNASLDCSVVPYPVGAYVAETLLARSTAGYHANPSLYGAATIALYNCPMVNWVGIVGTEIPNTAGHSFRSEGTWRSVHAHNEIQGHHHRDPPTEGVRQKITVRSCGSSEIDPGQQAHRHTAADNQPGAPMTRYAVLADNILGSLDDFGGGAKVSLAPTRADSAEVVSYGIVERNTFLEPADPAYATNDAFLSGFHLACRDNTHSTPGVRQDCVDNGQNAVPDPWYTPSILAGAAAPQPDAPGRSETPGDPDHGDESVCHPSPPQPFGDVPTTSFAHDDIACIHALGITTGTSPTTYSPAATVTREQMGAFLARLWRAIHNV